MTSPKKIEIVPDKVELIDNAFSEVGFTYFSN